MKTAISLPDGLFRAADKSAKRLGISRSELYARALAQFLRTRSGEEVTAALDQVYGTDESPAEPGLADLQRRVWTKERW